VQVYYEILMFRNRTDGESTAILARSEENVTAIDELVLRQEDQSPIHHSTRYTIRIRALTANLCFNSQELSNISRGVHSLHGSVHRLLESLIAILLHVYH